MKRRRKYPGIRGGKHNSGRMKNPIKVIERRERARKKEEAVSEAKVS